MDWQRILVIIHTIFFHGNASVLIFEWIWRENICLLLTKLIVTGFDLTRKILKTMSKYNNIAN